MKEINKINHKRWIKNAQLHLIPNLVSDIEPSHGTQKGPITQVIRFFT